MTDDIARVWTNVTTRKDFLHRCPICHSEAGIYQETGFSGIGDVGCSNTTCSSIFRGIGAKSKHFHYSGKFCIKKANAVGAWNYYCETMAEKRSDN